MKSWKTTVGGLLAAIGVLMRKDPNFAGYADLVEAIGVFLLGAAARDNKVSSEQAGAGITPPPCPPGIKLMPLVLVAFLFGGCVTGPDGARTVDAERVARIAGVAAATGSNLYLQKHPEHRGDFVIARNSLFVLESTGDFDPVRFADALKQLPIKELKGPEGALYVGLATIAFEELSTYAKSRNLDRVAWVKPVLVRVRAGLDEALAATAPIVELKP